MLTSQKRLKLPPGPSPQSPLSPSAIVPVVSCLKEEYSRSEKGPVHLPKACRVTPRTVLMLQLERAPVLSLRDE